MPSISGALRMALFAPAPSEVTFETRGFPYTPPSVRHRLEMIPLQVIVGFQFGMESRGQDEISVKLGTLEREHQGFGYEGATMALVLRDVMAVRRQERTARFLRGPAAPHIFLAYIGVGFAMARLPRTLWRRALPDLADVPLHPTLSWLAVDGFGFDRAYFQTRKWVDEQYVGPSYPWNGFSGYFPRAVDQGIGRALWFICGADADRVAAKVEGFGPSRRADLWSGVGLAAAFAGAAEAATLKSLRERGGQYYPDLAQGAVFAAKARWHAGSTNDFTHMATSVLADLSVEEAARLADTASEEIAGDASVPAYEMWRRRVQDHFR